MTTYHQVLIALEYLLAKAELDYWRDWIQQDIILWETKQDVSHHLSAYGGMGSLNDIMLGVENNDIITKTQETWVNNLFEILKALCYQLARAPHSDQSIHKLISNRYDAIFKAFRHDANNDSIDRASRELQKLTYQLHGWRCLQCGYSETQNQNLDDFLAKEKLPKYISQVQDETDLKVLVDKTFAMEFPELEIERTQLVQLVLNSGIKIKNREGWMRPCPKCGKDDTAVYRWERTLGESVIFLPSKDNLPLRK